MANLTLKQRRRGLEYADRLAAIACEAPDAESKSDVYAAINAIRRRNGFTTEQKKAMVLYYIRLGAATMSDLLKETGFRRQELQAIIADLRAENTVNSEPLQNLDRGRPTSLITLNRDK